MLHSRGNTAIRVSFIPYHRWTLVTMCRLFTYNIMDNTDLFKFESTIRSRTTLGDDNELLSLSWQCTQGGSLPLLSSWFTTGSLPWCAALTCMKSCQSLYRSESLTKTIFTTLKFVWKRTGAIMGGVWFQFMGGWTKDEPVHGGQNKVW